MAMTMQTILANGEPVADSFVELARENAQLKAQLAAVSTELESFTYSVSHDLRASLRHITSFVQIVQEDMGDAASAAGTVLDPQLLGHLKTISTSARHMALMIDGLMELSRLGRVQLQCAPVDLDSLVNALLGDVRDGTIAAGAKAAGRAIEWRLADDFPVVTGDTVLIRQVLRQLVANAIKFSGPAAPFTEPLRIRLGWRLMAPGICELQVADQGVGFDPKFAGKLFQVFQRLHPASQFEGLGMGLALCRRIVERHGGQIEATAAVGKGCEVRLTLPMAAP